MIRRLFIVIFVLSVACNALAAVSPHLEGDGACSTRCCRAARGRGANGAAAKLCCLTRCDQSAENQGSLAPGFLSSKQDNKDHSLSGSPFSNPLSMHTLRLERSLTRLVVPPGDIYL